MIEMSNLIQRLEEEEGRESHLYQDSEGIWTIGIGYNIQEKGLPDDIIDELFYRTIEEAIKDAKKIPVYEDLNDVRKSVLIAMVFQMGLSRVRGFRKMLQALVDQDFDKAADEMLDSRWAEQTPARAKREATLMREGDVRT